MIQAKKLVKGMRKVGRNDFPIYLNQFWSFSSVFFNSNI
jgi:hypothetical protein